MRTTQLVTILANQIAASSTTCLTTALMIIIHLFMGPKPGLAQWRQNRFYLGRNQPARERVSAIVDGAVMIYSQEVIEESSSFDLLTSWINATPHQWIRWNHLPSWGPKPSFAFVAAWDHNSRRCWIGTPLGEYRLLTYVEVESTRLRDAAITATNNLFDLLDEFRTETWTASELLDVAEQLNDIEDHLDDAHYYLSIPCRMGAGDYLELHLMDAIENIVTVEGCHLTPPNKTITAGSCHQATLLAGGKGWDVEPKKGATQEPLHVARENASSIGG